MSRDLMPLFAEIVAVEAELRIALDARLRRDCALPLKRFELIRVVAYRDRCLVRDLACELSLTTGGTSRLLDRVVEAGLCQRRSNPADRRSSIVELTEAGQRALADGSRAVNAELDMRFRLLDQASLEDLSLLLGRLAAAHASAP